MFGPKYSLKMGMLVTSWALQVSILPPFAPYCMSWSPAYIALLSEVPERGIETEMPLFLNSQGRKLALVSVKLDRLAGKSPALDIYKAEFSPPRAWGEPLALGGAGHFSLPGIPEEF